MLNYNCTYNEENKFCIFECFTNNKYLPNVFFKKVNNLDLNFLIVDIRKIKDYKIIFNLVQTIKRVSKKVSKIALIIDSTSPYTTDVMLSLMFASNIKCFLKMSESFLWGFDVKINKELKINTESVQINTYFNYIKINYYNTFDFKNIVLIKKVRNLFMLSKYFYNINFLIIEDNASILHDMEENSSILFKRFIRLCENVGIKNILVVSKNKNFINCIKNHTNTISKDIKVINFSNYQQALAKVIEINRHEYKINTIYESNRV